MKRRRKHELKMGICAALIVLIATALGSVVVSANSSDDIIKDGLDSAVDAVASDGSALADGMRGESIDELGENLTTLLSTEKIFEEISSVLKNALPNAVRLLATLMGLLLVCAAARGVSSGMDGEKTSAAFSFLSTTVITASLIGMQYGEIARARDFFEDIGTLMDAMIPVTGAVWAMGGNVTSASVGTATLYVMLAAVQKLVAGAVVPVCAILSASAACSSLGGGGIIGGFGNAVKKSYTFFIGLIMTVFVFVLGAQTTVAGAADTAAARSGKLIVSTVIPVVGGAVGETLRTVAGSVTYIKSVVGIGGILLIFVLTLPTLASLLLSRLVYLVVASVADAIGCHPEGRLLGELGNVYAFLVGAVSVTAIAFTIALALFVRCAVAVG